MVDPDDTKPAADAETDVSLTDSPETADGAADQTRITDDAFAYDDRPLTQPKPVDTAVIESVLKGLGVGFVHRIFPDPMRDPKQVALRLRAGVRQVNRTLVLRGRRSGDGFLFIINGLNQVSLRKLMRITGEEFEKPEAQYMREVVGYVPDGTPPFGHREKLRVYVDRDVMSFHNGWFPAGSPKVWMFMRTDTMLEACNGKLVELKADQKQQRAG
ncbi:MAG: YbaK/EbsC family protein [Pseudomonadota bacterium]